MSCRPARSIEGALSGSRRILGLDLGCDGSDQAVENLRLIRRRRSTTSVSCLHWHEVNVGRCQDRQRSSDQI